MSDELKNEPVIEEKKEDVVNPKVEVDALKADNTAKLMEELKKNYENEMAKLKEENEKIKLEAMDEKSRTEYLINKQIKDAEEKTAQVLALLEKERTEKEALIKVAQEKEFREKMQKLASEKPYLVEELALIKNEREYEVFVKPREEKLKKMWEFEMRDKNAGTNAFQGYKTTDEKKELTLDEIIKQRLAERIKSGK